MLVWCASTTKGARAAALAEMEVVVVAAVVERRRTFLFLSLPICQAVAHEHALGDAPCMLLGPSSLSAYVVRAATADISLPRRREHD